jgi:hypothetical protein
MEGAGVELEKVNGAEVAERKGFTEAKGEVVACPGWADCPNTEVGLDDVPVAAAGSGWLRDIKGLFAAGVSV